MLSHFLRRLLPRVFGLSVGLISLVEAIPAFPGAEGFGAEAAGGRGGDVYIVTNLNSSGAGSLYNGLTTIPANGRTIVFAVSGQIHLAGGIATRITGSKLTLAGQTAPGDGILLKDGTLRISGDDIVIRHLRFRHGKNGSGGDCINLDSGCQNAILDHISMSFSTDENMSSFGSPPDNLTMQWSLNAWGLQSHSCGGLWDQNRATCHHSVWAHNHTRNPKARPNGLLEWTNNVTFDWNIGFIMGDSQTPAAWKANVRGNYFICPPGNIRNTPLEKASLDRNGYPNFSVYQDNNLHDRDGDGILNGTDRGWSIVGGSAYNATTNPTGNYLRLTAPVAGSPLLNVEPPLVAYKKIVSSGGALRTDISYTGGYRDEVDTRLIQNLTTQTRNHISRESDLTGVSNGGFGTFAAAAAPVDSDKDGMPDFYETALGWNVATQDHNTALANSGGLITGTTFFPTGTVAGYTRLEEYLHYLAIPHGTVPRNITGSPTSLTVDLSKFTAGFTASPVFTVSNIIGGSIVQSGTGNRIVTFTPTLNFTGRARFDFTVTDSASHSWTQTCALVVTATGLPRDLSWRGTGNAWDTTTATNWLRTSNNTTVAYSNGDRVTFDQSGIAQPNVSVTGALSPGTVDVNASGNYTFSGTGSISSTGTLTKRGSGSLSVSSAQTYLGGTSLEAGNLSINSPGSLSGGSITMLDGTSLTNGYPSGTTSTLSAGINVIEGASVTLNSGNRFNLSGPLTGTGDLNMNVQTTLSRFDLNGTTAAFAGRINFINSGGVRLFFNGGSFNGFDNAWVDLGGSVSLQPQTNSAPGNTLNIRTLSGSSANASLAGGTAGAVAYVVGAGNQSTTFAGSITGNATFTKTGSGTLTLAGANTYTGATSVSSGALLIDGSLGASAVGVSSGALLGGDGSLGGSVTANAGAILSPGTIPFTGANLTIAGGLALNGNTIYCDLSNSPTGANDKITVGGTLALTGAQTFQFLLLDGTLNAGTYDLITATNSSASGVSLLHNLPTGTRQTFTLARSAAGSNPSKVWLTVVGNPATLTWTGGTNGNWDTTTAANWTGATPSTFGSNDAVVIDDSSSVLTLTPVGTVTPRSTLVNNSTKAFTLGAGLGGGVLTKSGSNQLTLTGANSHSATILNAGTIQLANATANASGLGTGPITLNGGTLKMFSAGDATYAGNLPNALIVSGTAAFHTAPRGGFSGNVSGTGTLNYLTSYVRADVSGNWSDFTGVLNVITDSGGGDFRIISNYAWAGLPNATVNLATKTWFRYDGILNSGAGTTIAIGALNGPTGARLLGGLTGGRALTYRIGGKNTDATFSGDISEQNTSTATNYVKTGTGTWTLSGSGSWNGGTIVEQGTLKLSGPYSCAGATTVESGAALQLDNGSLATDALNISAGATLTGNGTITGDLNNDGTITSTLGGTLAVTGDVVNNGTMRIASGTALSASGNFVNNGILDLLTASQGLPPNLENNGIVIDSSTLRASRITKSGNVVTIVVPTHSAHSYQLQRSTSLSSGWMDVGAPQSGLTTVSGAPTERTFTDNGANFAKCFYRVKVTP